VRCISGDGWPNGRAWGMLGLEMFVQPAKGIAGRCVSEIEVHGDLILTHGLVDPV
jgi:hypothetical protein